MDGSRIPTRADNGLTTPAPDVAATQLSYGERFAPIERFRVPGTRAEPTLGLPPLFCRCMLRPTYEYI